MARRNGRMGSWLVTDDYFGTTRYAEEIKRDYWGSYSRKPLLRNLQEIATPLTDPQPVSIYRGPSYEITPVCVAETAPLYVGNTNIPTSTSNAAMQVLDLSPAIPDMVVGCSFIVR